MDPLKLYQYFRMSVVEPEGIECMFAEESDIAIFYAMSSDILTNFDWSEVQDLLFNR